MHPIISVLTAGSRATMSEEEGITRHDPRAERLVRKRGRFLPSFLGDDRDHPVKSGHRITLTYELYHPESYPPSPVSDHIAQLKEALSEVINMPNPLPPDGGYIGFGMRHPYRAIPGDKFSDL